jgi:hypothetical protein
MKFHQNADGGVIPSVREYDIATSTAIVEGQVVVLSAGLVTAGAVDQTGAILGVAAESHSGSADALNPRSNGTKIKVFDGPHAVFRCPAPVITATGGTATTVIDTGVDAFSDDTFNGGYLKLLSKAAASTNTDLVGSVRRITDYTAVSNTFTAASGGTPTAGDQYAVFPPMGTAMSLDSTIQKLDITDDDGTALKVVGRIEGTNEILVMAVFHALGNDAD